MNCLKNYKYSYLQQISMEFESVDWQGQFLGNYTKNAGLYYFRNKNIQ
jgi:hypothetical protein